MTDTDLPAAFDAEQFSGLLLDLYRYARELTLDEFQRRALDRVAEAIPFDAAWWGMARTDRELHSSYLFRLPDDFKDVWEANKDDDVLAMRVIQNPGVTVVFDLPGTDRAPGLRTLFDRYAIHQVLCTLLMNPELKLTTFLSLYRTAASPPFTEGERRLKELLMPHLWATWTANWITQLAQIRAYRVVDRTAHAVADLRGVLHAAESRFSALVQREWPDWRGPTLPGPVRDAFRSGLPVRAQHVIVQVSPVSGLYLVQIRARSPLDRLTPRELTIAEGFGRGRSYKELAAALGLSPATVRAHLRAIYVKLGIGDKAELAHLLDAHPRPDGGETPAEGRAADAAASSSSGRYGARRIVS